MYIVLLCNYWMILFPGADSTHKSGTERGGGAPIQGRRPGPAAHSGAASISPCVPQPCRLKLLQFEHTGAASAHPVLMPQVSEPHGLLFNLRRIPEFKPGLYVYILRYVNASYLPKLWIGQRILLLTSPDPSQCVSGPCAPGPGEKRLLPVSALPAVFPWHPRSCYLCLPQGLYQVKLMWIGHFQYRHDLMLPLGGTKSTQVCWL